MYGESHKAAYLPLDGGRFRLAMGLMPLAEAEWLEIDDDLAIDLAGKGKLLATRHGDVFAALPEATASSAELLDMLAHHLCQHHAALFERNDDSLLNRATGERWDLARPTLHHLDLAGRLVQDDFCLMQSDGEAYRLIGATLCAPSRWSLAEKLGHPLAVIHEHVPGYGEKLARPVDRFFTLIKPEKPVWRINWGIGPDPSPYLPTKRALAVEITAENAGAKLWFRVERQTLRRLPATGVVVFGIRTYITRLDRALTAAVHAAEFASLIRQMPEPSLRYKGIAAMKPELLAWLDARAVEGPDRPA